MAQAECIFCNIAGGTVPASLLYEDEEIIAFPDINPRAPVHFLIVPRQHLPGVADASEEQAGLLGRMILVANNLAREYGLSERGYRLAINNGPDSGQGVFHLHLHLLGGRPLGVEG